MKIVLLIIISIAVVLLAIAGYKAYSIFEFIKITEVVPGKVVDYEDQSSGLHNQGGQGVGAGGLNVQGATYPVIEYTTSKEETLRFTARLTVSSLPEGDLTVRYSTTNPGEAWVNSVINFWIWAIVPGVIGLLLLLVGLALRAMLN